MFSLIFQMFDNKLSTLGCAIFIEVQIIYYIYCQLAYQFIRNVI